MRADEFIREAPIYPSTLSAVKKNYKDLGYKPAGRGLDARVYRHATKQNAPIIKVMVGAKHRAPEDASLGFLSFYKFVKANPGHPNLPKFGKPVKQQFGKETVYIVPMEPLGELQFHWDRAPGEAVDYDFLNIAFSAQSGETWGKIEKEDKQLLKKQNKTTIQKMKEFYNIVRKVVLFGYAENMTVDFHEGNFMRRKDGTIVITDPYLF